MSVSIPAVRTPKAQSGVQDESRHWKDQSKGLLRSLSYISALLKHESSRRASPFSPPSLHPAQKPLRASYLSYSSHPSSTTTNPRTAHVQQATQKHPRFFLWTGVSFSPTPRSDRPTGRGGREPNELSLTFMLSYLLSFPSTTTTTVTFL
ncbi:hypothetical protein BDY24DRAFT_24235 [Mrakia frigida]|uniref:uncharacterized protein n=1 Tax=Mrakia frigida TaxID=29902 RepID=UPI003FCC0703